MLNWFFNLSPTFKIAGLIAIFSAGFLSGIWLNRLIWQAAEGQALEEAIKSRDEAIDKLEKDVETQSQLAEKNARERAAWIEKFNDVNAKLESSYEKTPAITTSCIAPVRVRYLNEHRKAANIVSPR